MQPKLSSLDEQVDSHKEFHQARHGGATFNPSTLGGRRMWIFVSLRLTWSTYPVPGPGYMVRCCPRKTKTNKKIEIKRENSMKCPWRRTALSEELQHFDGVQSSAALVLVQLLQLPKAHFNLVELGIDRNLRLHKFVKIKQESFCFWYH